MKFEALVLGGRQIVQTAGEVDKLLHGVLAVDENGRQYPVARVLPLETVGAFARHKAGCPVCVELLNQRYGVASSWFTIAVMIQFCMLIVPFFLRET